MHNVLCVNIIFGQLVLDNGSIENSVELVLDTLFSEH